MEIVVSDQLLVVSETQNGGGYFSPARFEKPYFEKEETVISDKWLVINKTNPTLTTNSLNINHYNVGGENE